MTNIYIKSYFIAGSHRPQPYTGIKKCKWTDCSEIFEDAVEALKHIKDKHLKLGKQKNVHLNMKRKAAPTISSINNSKNYKF